MDLFNGACVHLSDIPVLSVTDFRAQIIASCGSGARLANFFGDGRGESGVVLFAVLAFDEDSRIEALSTFIPAQEPRYESLTNELFQANIFEREIAEQWAVVPLNHPWLKPLRYHSNYRNVPDVWPDIAKRVIPGCYEFYALGGEEAHEVGVGPVHAGIIEPGHFRFQCHGEEVLNLEIQLGYQHRGVEALMRAGDLKRNVLLSESIAGDTSIGHSIAFCEVVEALSGSFLAPRAQAIRAVALELERVANHVGDLGALSIDAGFLPASAYMGRMRGDYLNLLLSLTGNRFGKGLCRPGGVLFDIDSAMADDFCKKLVRYKKDFDQVSELLFNEPSVMARFEGVGIVTAELAQKAGLVGPVARASQLERDVRIDHACGIWQFHHVPISLSATGDVYARALVRRQEVSRSLEFLLKIIPSLPKGDIFTKPEMMAKNSFALSLVEGFRGEIMHVGMTDDYGNFMRYKVKDPSFNNWPGLSFAMRNQEIFDFPLCNKSFGLSYCGHDL
jgi:Ni,Fe-hydrogenase III large subunit